MKRLVATLALGLAFAGCESTPTVTPSAPGSGSEPSVEGGTFALTANDKELVASTDGQPMSGLLAAIVTVVGERRGQVKKEELITALDQAFEVKCHQLCEIKER